MAAEACRRLKATPLDRFKQTLPVNSSTEEVQSEGTDKEGEHEEG